MQIHILIDGNNVIGKSPSLMQMQRKSPQTARESLLLRLGDYYLSRKEQVTVFLDGFEKDKIGAGKVKIVYSNASSADNDIRKCIEREPNRKRCTVVSSDRAIQDFARKCSCTVVDSEKFLKQLSAAPKNVNVEKPDTVSGAENREFIELFTKKKRGINGE